MSSFVRGKIHTVTESSSVIDTGGLGYEVFMTSRDLARLKEKDEVFVFTSLQVREDAMTLYGFLSRDDLMVFRLLLGVSGIGPKGALQLLGAVSSDDLRFAVLSDDVKTISSAPGIGKKTAQKLILELKDKFKLEDAFENKLSAALEGQSAQDPAADQAGGQIREAVEALVSLGYSATEAGRAVKSVPDALTMDVEALLKAALSRL